MFSVSVDTETPNRALSHNNILSLIEIDIVSEDGKLAFLTKTMYAKSRIIGRPHVFDMIISDGSAYLHKTNGIKTTIKDNSLFSSGERFEFVTDTHVNKKQIFTYSTVFRLEDTFLESKEYWEQEQVYPTEVLVMRVVFPTNRAPSSLRGLFRARSTWGSSGLKPTERQPFATTVINRPAAEWYIFKPRHMEYYSLHWTW